MLKLQSNLQVCRCNDVRKTDDKPAFLLLLNIPRIYVEGLDYNQRLEFENDAIDGAFHGIFQNLGGLFKVQRFSFNNQVIVDRVDYLSMDALFTTCPAKHYDCQLDHVGFGGLDRIRECLRNIMSNCGSSTYGSDNYLFFTFEHFLGFPVIVTDPGEFFSNIVKKLFAFSM